MTKRASELMLGMGCAFPLRPLAESVSQILAPEWDAVPGSALKRKPCPAFRLQTGMRFPGGDSGGNCIPESMFRTGCRFR